MFVPRSESKLLTRFEQWLTDNIQKLPPESAEELRSLYDELNKSIPGLEDKAWRLSEEIETLK